MASLLNSAALAAGALTIALPVGMLLAALLTRFDIGGRRAAAAMLGMLLFLPLYVQLSGWDAALGKLGWFTLAHGSLAEPLLAGMRGAIFVHGIAAVPWVALIVGMGLLHVDPAQEEAALLVVPPRLVLWRVTLPQTLPFLLAATVWTIVSTTSDMTVTNIYLVNPREWTFTERFYMRMASGDTQQAAVAVLPGIVSLSVVILAALGVVAKLARRPTLTPISRPLTFSLASWRPITTAAVWTTLLLLIGVPIASLISKAGFVVVYEGSQRVRAWSLAACMHEVANVPLKFGDEIVGTTQVALGAASVALVAGGILAWRARRGGRSALPAVLIAVLGLTIPGPLVGTALIRLLNHDLPPAIPLADGSTKSWLLLLYDNTPLAPIMAQAIRALPLGMLLLWHSFATLNRDVLDAAALDGLAPPRVFWRVALPQRWRAVAAAWIAAFAVAAGDLAWSHLVTPPGLDLLSRRVFGLVHSGVDEQVAAISLMNIVVYAVLAAGVMALMQSPRIRTRR